MNNTIGFPPADALLEQIVSIDYKKHLNTFMDVVENVVLIVAAVSQVIWERFSQWYNNGGKETIINAYIKTRNFLQFAILWVREVGYPQARNFCQDCVEFTRAFRDLVTVA
jgi:hypothetical protein